MQVEKIDFIALPVEDLARADAFYGQTLGLARNPHTSRRSGVLSLSACRATAGSSTRRETSLSHPDGTKP